MKKSTNPASYTSRVLDALGRRLIGKPEQMLGDGFSDFYLLPGDREIHSMADARLRRNAIGANVFRRLLFTRVAIAASIASFALCVGGLIVLGSIHGVEGVARGWASTPPAKECALLAQSDAMGALTPTQRSLYLSRCPAR